MPGMCCSAEARKPCLHSVRLCEKQTLALTVLPCLSLAVVDCQNLFIGAVLDGYDNLVQAIEPSNHSDWPRDCTI